MCSGHVFLDISICACLHESGDGRGYVNVLLTGSKRDKESDHGEECNRAKNWDGDHVIRSEMMEREEENIRENTL
jgi:hypothetical protein